MEENILHLIQISVEEARFVSIQSFKNVFFMIYHLQTQKVKQKHCSYICSFLSMPLTILQPLFPISAKKLHQMFSSQKWLTYVQTQLGININGRISEKQCLKDSR